MADYSIMRKAVFCFIAFLLISISSEGALFKFRLINEELYLEIFNNSQTEIDYRTFSYSFRSHHFSGVDKIILAFSTSGVMYCNESNGSSSGSGAYFVVSKRQNSVLPNETKRKCIIDKEFPCPLLPEGSFYVFVLLREFKNENFHLYTIGPVKVQIGSGKSVFSAVEISKESVSRQALKFVAAMSDDLKNSMQNLRH